MTRRYHIPPSKQNLSLLKFQNSNIIMIFRMHIQLLLKSIQTMLKFENPLRNIRWLWNQRPLLIGTSPSNWEKPLHLEMTCHFSSYFFFCFSSYSTGFFSIFEGNRAKVRKKFDILCRRSQFQFNKATYQEGSV